MRKKHHKRQVKYNAKSRDKKREIGGKSSAPVDDLSFIRPDPSDHEAMLCAYFPGAFPKPFGMVHRKIIDAIVYAIKTGGKVPVAAPRGSGKTTIINGMLLLALLEGWTPFPVVIPWDASAKKRALRFWANELCFNRRLARDYPDICAPFVESRGIANRLTTLTSGGESTGARLGITDGIIVLPGGKGAIGSATINGNPRGLFYSTIDGRIVRPSFATIDDPQDRETAKSRTRILETIQIIDGDIAGMAGPDSRMAMVMPCTVIERGDVAEHYLDHPDWQAVRIGQILTWPKGFDKKGSRSRALWDEWNDIRQDGERNRDSGKAAVKFYKANKSAMVEGMTVSWDHRYDKARGEPDALYSAMHDFYVMGEAAFMAERQNAPMRQGVTIYNLTADVIQSRVTDRPAGVYPEWVTLRTASTDVNPSYGLTWGCAGFGPDRTAAVAAYGVHAMELDAGATRDEVNRAIYENLILLGKRIASMPCKPESGMWTIDAGGAAFDIVLKFCAESVKLCGIQAVASTGRGARKYKPWGKSVIGKPREQCHMASDPHRRKWIAWNADYWREQAQRSWTGSVGAPGSCSLPAGSHQDFAEQICREQLQGKGEIGGQTVWVWNTAPGPHDYGDVMGMCYMLAGYYGVGGVSPVVVSTKKKARVVIRR